MPERANKRRIWRYALVAGMIALAHPAHAQDAASDAPPETDGSAADRAPSGRRAFARKGVPAGMTAYDKPVYRNGRRVLYHGPSRGSRAQEAGNGARASLAPAPSGAALAGKAAGKAADGRVRLAIALDGAQRSDLAKIAASQNIVLVTAEQADADLFLAPAIEATDDAASLAAIARLYDCEVLAIGRAPSTSVLDLSNKTVAVAPRGTYAGEVARALLEAVAPTARPIEAEEPSAAMARGEAEAFVAVGARPRLERAPKDARVLSVPYEGAVKAQFLPAEIGKADYPGLMAGRASVDIVASPAVLVARPSQDPERRAALDRFVPAFLTALNAGALKDAKWREVNPVARVPIARLPSAQDWIDKRRTN